MAPLAAARWARAAVVSGVEGRLAAANSAAANANTCINQRKNQVPTQGRLVLVTHQNVTAAGRRDSFPPRVRPGVRHGGK